jgi:hypothetical protein
MMEEVRTCESSVCFETVRLSIPEGYHLHRYV